jgi:hypothetical protein
MRSRHACTSRAPDVTVVSDQQCTAPTANPPNADSDDHADVTSDQGGSTNRAGITMVCGSLVSRVDLCSARFSTHNSRDMRGQLMPPFGSKTRACVGRTESRSGSPSATPTNDAGHCRLHTRGSTGNPDSKPDVHSVVGPVLRSVVAPGVREGQTAVLFGTACEGGSRVQERFRSPKWSGPRDVTPPCSMWPRRRVEVPRRTWREPSLSLERLHGGRVHQGPLTPNLRQDARTDLALGSRRRSPRAGAARLVNPRGGCPQAYVLLVIRTSARDLRGPADADNLSDHQEEDERHEAE